MARQISSQVTWRFVVRRSPHTWALTTGARKRHTSSASVWDSEDLAGYVGRAMGEVQAPKSFRIRCRTSQRAFASLYFEIFGQTMPASVRQQMYYVGSLTVRGCQEVID
jgi:hypothetical protein